MDDDQLSRFLGNFETKVYFEENKESFPGRRVFWSQNLQQNSNEIHGKVKSAFSSIDVPRLKGLIQFWAPLATTEGRHLLSTSDQPFVLEDLDPRLCKYRLHSVRYQYSIDDHNDNTSIISNGFVATAFHNRFPEVLLDLRQMISIEDGRSTKDPLVYSALNCDLTSSILFPIFYHSSSCVGVVECCMKVTGLLIIFNQLKSALERVGLTTYPIQEGLPDMTMDSFKRVRDEIEDALKFVCESHHLALGQVWIPYYDDYVSFTSSSTLIIRSQCLHSGCLVIAVLTQMMILLRIIMIPLVFFL
uniref:protein NLP4-like n=1 Tax=Erigeron canadensis TaxID=72917 RepID=UPI001CB96A86|nr:protein NLP4-like [Erigeron canadensis]